MRLRRLFTKMYTSPSIGSAPILFRTSPDRVWKLFLMSVGSLYSQYRSSLLRLNMGRRCKDDIPKFAAGQVAAYPYQRSRGCAKLNAYRNGSLVCALPAGTPGPGRFDWVGEEGSSGNQLQKLTGIAPFQLRGVFALCIVKAPCAHAKLFQALFVADLVCLAIGYHLCYFFLCHHGYVFLMQRYRLMGRLKRRTSSEAYT